MACSDLHAEDTKIPKASSSIIQSKRSSQREVGPCIQ